MLFCKKCEDYKPIFLRSNDVLSIGCNTESEVII